MQRAVGLQRVQHRGKRLGRAADPQLDIAQKCPAWVVWM